MKAALVAILVLLATTTEAQDVKVYATDKHGNTLRQTHVIKDAKYIYETDKYGNKKQQTHVVRDLKIYQTDKHGNILYHKPAITTR